MINQQRISDEFARMASISSPSFREGAMAQYLEERFVRMGAEVEFDDAATKIDTENGNMIARFAANGKEGEPFLLTAHMDTVEPADGVEPVLRDGVFYSAGDTVLGADDKCGIAEIIEAIEVLKEQQIPYGPIEVVITVCEERGLLGAKQMDLSQLKSTRGLALDTTGVDCVTNRAPGSNRMVFTVDGIEAHAGIAPEKGLSAIRVASAAIARMPLGKIDEITTANIGRFNGGVADNIVAKQVVITGEARSHDIDRLKKQTDAMVQAFESAADEHQVEIDGELKRAKITADISYDYPIMAVADDAPILSLVKEASAVLDRPLTINVGGGGSDANIFTGGGIDTLILGSGMTNVHSVDECVSVDDMVRVSETLVEVLRRAW